MSFDTYNITDQINLLAFDRQRKLASTFMRFQEHYESPEFRNTTFTRDDYKEWYRDETGSFTYFEDWNGFNIPSSTMKPFYEGDFDPLHDHEKTLLDHLQDEPTPFYLIGIHRERENPGRDLTHETAHGLFHTDDEYRDTVKQILSSYDTSTARNELLGTGGYHNAVITDEIHAYSIANPESLDATLPNSLQSELQTVFNKHSKKNNVNRPSV